MKVIFTEKITDNLDEISEKIYGTLIQYKISSSIAKKLQLQLETLCLILTEANRICVVTLKKNLIGLSFDIEYDGECFNLLNQIEENDFLSTISTALNIKTKYSYINSTNNLNGFMLTPSKLSSLSTLLSIITSVLFVVFIKTFFPEQAQTITTNILQPFFSLMIKCLITLAVPLIFFSQIESITQTKDLSEFKKNVLVFCRRIAIISIIIGSLTSLFMIIAFNRYDPNIQGNFLNFSFSFLLDFFPSNILEPITTSNILLSIIVGTLIGVALVKIGEKGNPICEFVSAGTNLFMYLLDLFKKTMPLLIFLSITILFLSTNLESIYRYFFIFILTVGFCAIACLLFALYSSFKTKQKISFLIKTALKPAKTAFLTASSLAARNDIYNTALNDFKINKFTVSSTLNLGSVMFWPGSIIYRAIIVFSTLKSVTLLQMLQIIIVIIFIAIITPSVSGGGAITSTLLLSLIQADLIVWLPVYIFFDLIIDYFVTGTSVFFLALEMNNTNQILNKNSDKYRCVK